MRTVGTAVMTPFLFSYRTGHFRSSFKMAAVSKAGDPLPWYTYPCIDFLKCRPFEGKTVLEFGGGQSTLWWAKRAHAVVTLEGDKEWYEKIARRMPPNVELHHVASENATTCVDQVEEVLRLKPYSQYDIIVIDGLYRREMIEIALRLMAPDGMIICDDAEGYGFYEGFKASELNRVDFFGYPPGGSLPHATSVYFGCASFGFSSTHPIRNISLTK
jgi:hypothetical protein